MFFCRKLVSDHEKGRAATGVKIWHLFVLAGRFEQTKPVLNFITHSYVPNPWIFLEMHLRHFSSRNWL